MKKPLVLLACAALIFNFTTFAKAASTNFDGTYDVKEWTETCDSLVEYENTQFDVMDGAVVNLSGPDGTIASDGSATVNHYFGSSTMSLMLTFTSNGTTNTATGTWISDSSSGDCHGTIIAESTNYSNIITYVVLGIVGIVGVIVVIIILIVVVFVVIRRGRSTSNPQSTQTGSTGSEPPKPLETPSAENAQAQTGDQPGEVKYGPKRAVYGDKIPPKKKGLIWPELKLKRPKK